MYQEVVQQVMTTPDGKDVPLRCELVGGSEEDGPARLVSIRKLRWGIPFIMEKPLIRILDLEEYLAKPDADPRLRDLATALDDAEGLASYIAFTQLHARKQKEFMDFYSSPGRSGEIISAAGEHDDAIDRFLVERPEYKRWLDWGAYKRIHAVVACFGIRCPDGKRCIYPMISHLRHSWRPNAVWETSKHFPQGTKVLRIIAHDGIPKGAEITVSLIDEASLLKPREQGRADLQSALGPSFMMRSVPDPPGLVDEDMVRTVLSKLMGALSAEPPTPEDVDIGRSSLKEFEQALPFSMVFVARARCRIVQMIQMTATHEDNLTIRVAKDRRQQLLDDIRDYQETAIKELEVLLGEAAEYAISKLLDGFRPIEDEQTFLEKYTRPRSRQAIKGG